MRRDDIRAVVRGCYDLQKLRIQTGLRLVATFKVKLGQAPSTPEVELDAEAKELLDTIRLAYTRISDYLAEKPRAQFKADGVINTFTEYALAAHYFHLLEVEESQFAYLGKILKDVPVYKNFLAGVLGVGPAMAGVIVSEIDIHKSRYASSIWKYAGLDVAEDGAGRSRRKEHLVKVKYQSKDGEESERDSITFNPFLKTKLVGVLGGSFLRCAKSPYRQIYLDYKHRLENHPAHIEKTKGHRHNMAVRYMIKMFLIDLYKAWRALEGLSVEMPYHEAKLGLKHAA